MSGIVLQQITVLSYVKLTDGVVTAIYVIPMSDGVVSNFKKKSTEKAERYKTITGTLVYILFCMYM